jgi:tRNA A37 threonylcarbamoyladenosine dehydratase
MSDTFTTPPAPTLILAATPEQINHIAPLSAEAAAERARRVGGVARLYGAAALSAFEQAHVAVIGIGGVGSWVVEALARSAIGQLTLIDLDNIAPSNTNRQIHALEGNYGRAKVTAMAERIALIDPQCKVIEVEDFAEPDNFDALLSGGFDYIVDAIDSVRTKTALIAWCVARGQPIITVGGAGGQLDPTRIRIDDLTQTIQDPLLSKVRAGLRKQYGFARGPKVKFKVPAVYSDEPLIYPNAAPSGAVLDAAASLLAPGADAEAKEAAVADASAAADAEFDAAVAPGPVGLNCAGFGSSVCVTAGFGFAAAAYVLRVLAVRANQTKPAGLSTTGSGALR